MFKVIIIDDEPLVRKGLVTVINWEQLGCHVVAEASNGVDGMALIETLRPDIILTDIQMPEVDGLTMIRNVKALVAHSKIIILTGYRDFDYIHEAMQLGAFDYLLKPSKLDEIVKVIKKAALELKYDLQHESIKKEWEVRFNKALPILKEILLRDIMISAVPVDESVKAELNTFKIKLDHFVVVLLEISQIEDLYNRNIIKFGVINTFEELFSEQFEFERVDIGNSRVAFIVNTIDKGIMISKLEELIDVCKKCFDLTVTIAMSAACYEPELLSKKAYEVLTAIDYSFYLGRGSVILYEDLKLQEYTEISVIEPMALQMMRSIKIGNEVETLQSILEIEQITKSNQTFHQVDLTSFIVRCIYDIYNFVLVEPQLNPIDFNLEPVSLHNQIQASAHYSELISILREIAIKVSEHIHILKQTNINNIIKDTIKFIKGHYREALTLNDLATEVNVSTYYLSRMFKKETGSNISEYLNDIRLQAAKGLLCETDLKLYEVGERVGIPDPHYFSRLFKKQIGITPSQYREKANMS
ncbi:response regulator [Fusibacter sp. 3D3]|uniref:response regulator n=1 Tax=Fusibacter sp. 3D3 TaxID=1048380 RepID=UPI0008535CCF|nr:response regulator [Fusibacter sp. 3D3]GAU77304.1 two-component response regulator yesN [Fusibacter sp. 3D3]